MPPPNRRQDPSPGELARQIADQLARSQPATTQGSLRNSVLMGRLALGVTMLVSIVVVVAGANWLLAQTTGPRAEVLAKTVTLDDGGESADITTTTGLEGTLVPLAPLMFPTPLVDNGDSAAGSGATAVTIPAATTTTSTPSTSSSVSSSTSMPTTTTGQVTTSTSSTATTAAPPPSSTTTVPETTTTMPSTTTTVGPTTTTTLPTTTTVATSTTTEATTTTTRPSPPSTPGQG